MPETITAQFEDETKRIVTERALEHINALRVCGSAEILDNDRWDLGHEWVTARIRLMTHPASRGHFRRFYIHLSGLVIEGGRGGARIFDCSKPVHPLHPGVASHMTIARARSIRFAAEIVEALDG